MNLSAKHVNVQEFSPKDYHEYLNNIDNHVVLKLFLKVE